MDANYYMNEALIEAKKAFSENEVPVGCVIVQNDIIIAKAHNTVEKDRLATSHAELLAINMASLKLQNWRLCDCDLYVTLEPCSMCGGAIINSRIRKVYIGVLDKTSGAFGGATNLTDSIKTNLDIIYGVKTLECKALLTDFFKSKR
ncbi:MAG: nucleoside deaminase [Clostridia bacterium]